MRRVASGALLVVLVVCLFEGVSRFYVSGGGARIAATATPVLSARRVPAALAQLAAAERIAAQLTSTVAGIPSTQAACLDLRVGGTDVFAASPDVALVPASNMKLLTAFAVLRKLGPDEKLTTSAVMQGDALYLVGGGDPLLSTTDFRRTQKDWTEYAEPISSLESLADKVRAAGVTSVGAVMGDGTRYDAERTVSSWKSSYVTSGQISPVSALEVNGGVKSTKADPAAAAATTFAALLRARGVQVGGPIGTGAAPPAKPVASVDSMPMQDVVGEMLRESDNLAAEMLTKELGARFGGGGTWAAGIRVIQDTLRAAGIPLDGLLQADGSGLDRSDRLTCHTLVAVLSDEVQLGAALPTAGSCGTLVHRFAGTDAAGRILAKTGSLTGISALSGYVLPATADPACPPATPPPATDVAFALLVNGVSSMTAAEAIEDSIAVALSTYPELPNLDRLGPQP